MPKLLVLAFLQVKLKKNAKTINSGILMCKNFKKKMLKLLVQRFYK
jgi:hypothetical protein